ncbi:MAG TPA: benzoate-CoA ligase family protein [Burkholderiales bacterium]
MELTIPREYNAAADLVGRNLQAGRGGKVAYIDDEGSYTFAELARRVDRFASALVRHGVQPESRVMIAMLDTIDWPVAFLGAIKAGAVPVAANTLLTSADYRYMIEDSRARLLFVSDALLPAFSGVPNVIAGKAGFERFMQNGAERFEAARTTCDDACFWLYSSGSTGVPKGTVHVQSSPLLTAELYARPVLGLREDDVVFSAAKLFFAYGLGNALSFPLAVGATTILMSERPTPAAVFKRLTKPTVFYGVPTLYAALLAADGFPKELNLRICTSAGEALPKELGERWKARTGVDILDGIGSTEMLHIFLSNRPGEVRYGTTGKPVPGYRLKLTGESGEPLGAGQVGDLWISGPTAAAGYWNQREKSRATFCGEWTRSGDKYSCDAEGFYTYAGRSDDMLKVSGIYVSPFEVEAALASHDAVLEAAVVGAEDAERLVKPKAYVVLKAGRRASDEELKLHVKARLAPYKYPRWIEFVPELPKTATGKIQRFKLRQLLS